MSIEKKKYFSWVSLLIISAIGLILMLSSTFIDWEKYKIDNIEYDREHWKTSIIVWFYFTFQSNLLALIISIIVITRKIDVSNIHLQRGKVMMSTNLTVTCIIFWAVLFGDMGSYSALGLTSTLIIHAITPVVSVAVFIFEGYKTKLSAKITPLKTTLLITAYPVIWLIVAIIIYFSMGANRSSAIYGFLDFNSGSIVSYIVLVVITIMYPSLVFGYQWFYSREWNNVKA